MHHKILPFSVNVGACTAISLCCYQFSFKTHHFRMSLASVCSLGTAGFRKLLTYLLALEVYFFWTFHINEIMASVVWVFSFSIISTKFICYLSIWSINELTFFFISSHIAYGVFVKRF